MKANGKMIGASPDGRIYPKEARRRTSGRTFLPGDLPEIVVS